VDAEMVEEEEDDYEDAAAAVAKRDEAGLKADTHAVVVHVSELIGVLELELELGGAAVVGH
jgi:hypothetical protein